jgi:radical SAM superfamily enzyme YgiQ (UPF0313 family)
LTAFLGEYVREIGRPFQCLVHPRYLDDEIARLLKDSGCQHVQMGVQSADAEYKRTQLLRMEKEAHMERSLEALKSADLDVKLDHMLGLPGEPMSAQETALELYRQYPPRRIQTFWLTHLPGVELTVKAVEMGELSSEDYERIIRGEGGRFHTRSAGHAADASLYRRYQLLFRVLPLLPRWAQRRVGVRHAPPLPPRLSESVGVVLEVINAVIYRDDESFCYARQYGKTFRWQIPELLRRLARRRVRGGSAGPVGSRPVPGDGQVASGSEVALPPEPSAAGAGPHAARPAGPVSPVGSSTAVSSPVPMPVRIGGHPGR